MIYLIISDGTDNIENQINDMSQKELKHFIKDKTIPELNILMNIFLKKEKYEYCALIRDRLEQLNG
jgi:protein-arginine kinase activator protein McsA